MSAPPQVSFVLIGLNEAEHLPAAIGAVEAQGIPPERREILFVDSGSDDDSPAIARRLGVDRVIELPREGGSAARGRNAGLAEARGEFVQFVDADTTLAPGWTADGVAALRADPGLAGVDGRLREARPGSNLFHAVCELDWPGAAGEVSYVGGNSLYRTGAIREAGGFDPRMVVGEEPELGTRLRARGWRFRQLDRDMAQHDLDLRSFGDYLRRCFKSGLSCGMVVRATGGPFRGFWRQRWWRTLAIAAGLGGPALLGLGLLPRAPGVGALVWLLAGGLWAAAVARKAWATRRAGHPVGLSLAYALHTYLGKLPAAWGILASLRRPVPTRGGAARGEPR